MQAEIWEQVNFPPAPILSSQESVESIQLAPGFRLELVASEPLDNDPVTIAWEKDGRLYAVEMRDYMLDVHRNGEEEAIGRMVVLKYTDDDVVVDKSTVVMDGLVLPRAITIVKGGLLVAKPPNIPVRLAGSHDNQFDISQSRSQKNLRSDAEENAKFLSLPIHDEISSSTRIREVDLLDGSIKDKFKKRSGNQRDSESSCCTKISHQLRWIQLAG